MVVFDECVPRPLRADLPGFRIRTVRELGLDGFKNGRLLAALPTETTVFLTLDRALQHQQNLQRLDFGVVLVLSPSNRLEHLLPAVPAMSDALKQVRPGTLVEIRTP